MNDQVCPFESRSPQQLRALSDAMADRERWFTQEVHAHGPRVKAYLRGAFPSVHDVDDVVQESYIRVWKALASGPILSAKALLFRVARNIAIDVLRRKKACLISLVGDLERLNVIDDVPTAEAISTEEKVALLSEAISRLPSRCREVIILCKINGHSYREAAELLGLSEKTIAEHLYRGTQRLGCELQKCGIDHCGQ